MIVAVVLAAGLSRRMGRFKLTLPWRGCTVIGHVVQTLKRAGFDRVLIVTGHRADEIAAALEGTGAELVYNAAYATNDMLSSLQAGLSALQRTPAEAALLCLGDQPQMEGQTIEGVLAAGAINGWQRVIIPSYQQHAGHPILLPRALWGEILGATGTLREVLKAHRELVVYVNVTATSILADLDTPEDYQQHAGDLPCA